LSGFLDHRPFGARTFLAEGRVETVGEDVTYRARLRLDGGWRDVSVTRTFHDDPGPDAWSDSRRARLVVAGRLDMEVRMSLGDAAGLIASVEPVGAHGVLDRTGAAGTFVAHGLRDLLQRY
jgi:hypothetical protein